MITASIVLYNTPKHQLNAVFGSIFKSKIIDKLYVIDNSPNDLFLSAEALPDIVCYIHNENLGYGASHNIALQKAIERGSDYHIVLNPDIYFEPHVLNELLQFLDAHLDAAYVMPKVTYPNGELQYLCKLLPTPFDLIFRRFFPCTKWLTKKNERYELRASGYDKIMNPPCLSGCFMFLRLSTLKEYNLFFDDSFFMYCEDFDFIRRIHRVAKTIYYPNVSIVHDHAKASYKSWKMLKIHIKSAIHYFNKWGWLFDKERKMMNEKILKEIKEMNVSSPE